VDKRRKKQAQPVYQLVRPSQLPAHMRTYLSAEWQQRWWTAVGSLLPLQPKKLALFSSVSCPGDLLIKSYDLAQLLRRFGVAVVSGFQSPVEKACLDLLLCGMQPIIIVPAKSLKNFRVPPAQRRSLSLNRLLYLSPFSLEETRTSVRACLRRNQMVAALAEEILFVHASPGGKSQRLFDELIRQERKVHVVQSDFNRHLVECGAQPIEIGELANWLSSSGLALSLPPTLPAPVTPTDRQFSLF